MSLWPGGHGGRTSCPSVARCTGDCDAFAGPGRQSAKLSSRAVVWPCVLTDYRVQWNTDVRRAVAVSSVSVTQHAVLKAPASRPPSTASPIPVNYPRRPHHLLDRRAGRRTRCQEDRVGRKFASSLAPPTRHALSRRIRDFPAPRPAPGCRAPARCRYVAGLCFLPDSPPGPVGQPHPHRARVMPVPVQVEPAARPDKRGLLLGGLGLFTPTKQQAGFTARCPPAALSSSLLPPRALR